MKLEELKSLVGSLCVLLDDPQPGLMSWNMCLGEKMGALCAGWLGVKPAAAVAVVKLLLRDPRLWFEQRLALLGILTRRARETKGKGEALPITLAPETLESLEGIQNFMDALTDVVTDDLGIEGVRHLTDEMKVLGNYKRRGRHV